jgi:ubiquinone/menaquinone biosynthesis C-methylase UbiE
MTNEARTGTFLPTFGGAGPRSGFAKKDEVRSDQRVTTDYDSDLMSLWSRYVLPPLIETACRSHTIAAERARWVPRAHGRVLEIGVGSGLNLAYYDASRVERVTAIDPSAPLLERAALRVTSSPVPIDLVQMQAEALPFEDASFDSAVITYTLCSVESPRRALAEMHRVLRPSGELLLVEHGLAPDVSQQRWQRWITPAWRRVGGGCRLDRDVLTELKASGFSVDEIQAAYGEGPRWLGFTYQGVALKER